MADVVLLVDGSWSIGRINFKTIRNFIARMVSVFDIGPERVQIGNIVTTITNRTTAITATIAFQLKDHVHILILLCLLCRSGSVQWRSKDRVAPERPPEQGVAARCCSQPAVQRRKHDDR